LSDSTGPAGALALRRDEAAENSFVVKRPVAITMLMLSMAVFGVVSFFKLRQNLLPEISYPTLTVRTSWDGAAPEDVEQRISVRISESLGTLKGLVRSSSTSRAGVSDILLEFDWGTQMSFAVQDVREKIDQVRLPEGVERPIILRYDPNLDPVLRIGLTSNRDLGDPNEELIALRWIAENRIKRELESIGGVAAVQVRGGLEEELHVEVDPGELASRQLSLAQVSARLAQENINAAGGSLREGSTDYIVRTVNEFENLEEISNLALVRRGGATIRLADVAKITSTYKKREVTSRIDGSESVELAIFREAGADLVAVAEAVRQAVFGTEEQQKAAAKMLADGVEPKTLMERNKTDYLAFNQRKELDATLLSDQSVFIRQAVADVRDSALIGAVLAIAVIWVFLRRLSATGIIAIAIPISIVVAFAPMYLGGVSLNIMSLGGLALGVGMLVDNAIVVLESITRCREEGDEYRTAAVRGVREVTGAVVASTLTTVCVFAPIVFVTGIAGQIFGDQALTVVSALTVSLIVAVLFIPMLASRRWLAGDEARAADPAEPAPPRGLTEGLSFGGLAALSSSLVVLGRLVLVLLGLVAWLVGRIVGLVYIVGRVVTWPFAKLFELGWNALENGYPRALAVALRVNVVIILLAAVLGWDAWRRIPHLGVELLPEIHQGEFTAFVQLDVGNPLEETDVVMQAIGEQVRLLDGVAATALTVGVEEETLSQDIEGPHTARLSVRMDPDDHDEEAEQALVARVRELISRNPAVRTVDIRRPTLVALASPVAVEVRGHRLESLRDVSQDVLERLEARDDLRDVQTSMRPGFPEVRVTFDRDKALEYGLDLATVSKLVRDSVLGEIATRFTRGDERIDLRVMADEERLARLADVLDLVVNPEAAIGVPLRAVADVETVEGPAEIRRIGNSRAILVTASRAGFDLGGTADAVEGVLASMEVPGDVVVELGGQKREMDEATRSMLFALLLAIFLVYVVMATQFESLTQPLIVLLTVPLAAVGVIYTLDYVETPLSVVVFIGLILLAGIVVNNAIVLVDRINQNRTRLGPGHVREAVIEASRVRLRPILMTTATTVLGLLPLTGWLDGFPLVDRLVSGEGAELRRPMAIAVVSGLLSSTVLTLFVIPCVYTLFSLERRERPGGSSNGATA
jgi:hydrophobic/amphiphilic exporter-1 (mainly G- bacteria), HAE1 family